ncbi:MAG: 4Fe-4S binding protein [Acidobacteriota bacterium]|nr:4Fe-4S binding protein [Acidobacteriota bacterium]
MDSKRGKRLQRLRIFSQVLFIWIFFYLLVKSGGAEIAHLPQTGLFFYLDPLFLWVNLLSGRFLHAFLLALIPLFLTLVLGRFFCGWVCPLGGLHQFFSWLGWRRSRKKASVAHGPLRLKYLLLIVLLIASLFASQLLGWLDPFSLLTRSVATVVLPGGNFLLQHALQSGGQDAGWAGKAVRPLYEFSRRSLLTVRQRTFLQPAAIGLLFFGLLLLNLRRRRFFCNSLCPLGAFYGFLARFSLLRLAVNEKCRKCNACADHCTYNGSPYQDYLKSECVLCGNCLVDCPAAAIDFRIQLPGAGKRPALDLGRRRLLGAAGCGLVVAALPQVAVSRQAKAHPFIRPPGAVAEKEFLKKCVRCGACMQACPTNAVQPAVFQAGLEGLWTPLLLPASGYCEYECNRCTQVCPTHALASLTLEEKKQFKIGTAVVNRSTCYTYADGYNCAVCEEHCPVPEKAIRLRAVEVQGFRGRLKKVDQVYVVPDLCIGCGICESVCPRTDAPAIRVGAEEEQRENPYG